MSVGINQQIGGKRGFAKGDGEINKQGQDALRREVALTEESVMRKDYWLVAMVRLAVCTPWRGGYEGGQGTGAGEGKCWVGVRVRVRARVSEFARVGEWRWRRKSKNALCFHGSGRLQRAGSS